MPENCECATTSMRATTPTSTPALPLRPEGGDDQVVLLDLNGTPSGTADRAGVHNSTTPLHLAFSCYLFDARGRVLLTRRALAKATWPGVWTNTCCGHPRPGESPRAAVQRRLQEELGVAGIALRMALPHFSYRAVDDSGIVENEICPVWVGRVEGRLAPDPAEVIATTWVDWIDLVTLARTAPALLSPWSVLQIPQLAALDAQEEVLP
ncbi:MAG: isopentenyl-diphosphate Delta-isomerase [Candidatus Nanopelagicales bacterium]